MGHRVLPRFGVGQTEVTVQEGKTARLPCVVRHLQDKAVSGVVWCCSGVVWCCVVLCGIVVVLCGVVWWCSGVVWCCVVL